MNEVIRVSPRQKRLARNTFSMIFSLRDWPIQVKPKELKNKILNCYSSHGSSRVDMLRGSRLNRQGAWKMGAYL